MKEAEKERRRIGQELMKEKMKKERDEMKKVSESISNRKAAHRAELEAIRSNYSRYSSEYRNFLKYPTFWIIFFKNLKFF